MKGDRQLSAPFSQVSANGLGRCVFCELTNEAENALTKVFDEENFQSLAEKEKNEVLNYSI